MAVAMVVGNDFKFTLIGPSTTLTALLASKLRETPAGLLHSGLIYIALILLMLTLGLNLAARVALVERTARRAASR